MYLSALLLLHLRLLLLLLLLVVSIADLTDSFSLESRTYSLITHTLPPSLSLTHPPTHQHAHPPAMFCPGWERFHSSPSTW